MSACWSVITAVKTMKNTGSANASETAIRKEWFATDIRKPAAADGAGRGAWSVRRRSGYDRPPR